VVAEPAATARQVPQDDGHGGGGGGGGGEDARPTAHWADGCGVFGRVLGGQAEGALPRSSRRPAPKSFGPVWPFRQGEGHVPASVQRKSRSHGKGDV